MKTSRKPTPARKWQIPEKYQLFLMLFPFLVLVFIFSYLPLTGWRYAFYMYRPGFDLSKCEYVGFYWFQSIFSNSYQIKEISRVMINTLAISGLGLLLNCFAALATPAASYRILLPSGWRTILLLRIFTNPTIMWIIPKTFM